MATPYDTYLEGNCGIDEAAESREDRIEAKAEAFRADPLKVKEADEWMYGSLSEAAYEGLESVFADAGDVLPDAGPVTGAHLAALPQPVIDALVLRFREASARRDEKLRQLAETAVDDEDDERPAALAPLNPRTFARALLSGDESAITRALGYAA